MRTLAAGPVIIRVLAPVSIVLLIAGGTPDSAGAGVQFESPEIPVGESPAGMIATDLNGDGFQDLAVANFFSKEISVLLGRGDGSFAPETRYESGTNPISIANADFNGDGAQDLAIANFGAGLIAVLLGNGDGTFAPRLLFTAGVSPFFVTVGDFNADGDVDIVASLDCATAPCNFPTGAVSVHLGRGDGRFAARTIFEVGNNPISIATGDLNRDGRQDLVVANNRSRDVSVLLGLGNGSFAPQMRFAAGDSPASVAIGDLDGDGREDFMVANGLFSSDISVLLGRGDGSFGPQTRFQVGERPVSVAARDFNHDGHLDVAVANLGASFNRSSEVSVLLGRGDGTFGPDVRYQAGDGPFVVVIDELNGDGEADLAVANSASDDISILSGRGDGTFAFAQNRFKVGFSPVSVAIGDLNADGKKDLAVGTLLQDTVSILSGFGDGTFGAEAGFPAGRGAALIQDLNDDGLQDVVVTDERTHEVSVLLGLGDGTFDPQMRFDTGFRPIAVTVADFSRDGRQDIAVANQNSDDVSILLGIGDGTFLPEARFMAGSIPTGIAVGDLNGDGAHDLAVANNGSGDVSVLLNLGDGTFGAQSRLDAGIGPVSVAIGDFTGEGRMDIAAANRTSDDLSLFVGRGDGTFEPGTRVRVGNAPRSVAFGDFNFDGRQDIAVANQDSNDVSVFVNRGNGLFDMEVRFHTGAGPAGLAIGDINADSRQDIIVVNILADNVQVLLNKTSVTNAPPTADAGRDIVAECSSINGGTVRLDGTGSTDPDSSPGTNDDIDSFEWFASIGLPEETLLGTGETLNTILAVGTHLITLRVTDRSGEADTDEVLVTVADTTPPVMTCPALAAFECTGPEGALINLVADASDACSPAVQISNNRTPNGADASGLFPLGSTRIVFEATDGSGNLGSCASTVSVQDTTPPDVAVTVVPPILWPPNHRMQDVETLLTVEDSCSPASVILESVVSDEPDDAVGGGDGQTVDDIQGADAGNIDFQFQLRAERSGIGAGRSYRANYRATDSVGNTALATAIVFAPHDLDGVTEPMLLNVAENETGTILIWAGVPGAHFYNVARGDVENLQDQNNFFHLGPLTCIAPSATRTRTLGLEDSDIPAPGDAFFYVAEYNDGVPSGYGTESAAKERFAPPGQGGCS